MKIAVCAICRTENIILRDWVEWYKNLGVDKIFLYDNNFDDEDNVRDDIGDYIDTGFVDVIECNHTNGEYDYIKFDETQLSSYTDCYNNHINCSEYDWCCFFDIDEFLSIGSYKSISEFIQFVTRGNQDISIVNVNWMQYNDSNKIHYDTSIPIYKQMTELEEDSRFPYRVEYIDKEYIDTELLYRQKVANNTTKIIVKRGLKNALFKSQHMISVPYEVKAVDSNGDYVNQNWIFITKPKNFRDVHLKHFIKPLELYMETKYKRFKNNKYLYGSLQSYFSSCEITKEKIEFLKEKYDIDINKDIFGYKIGIIILTKSHVDMLYDCVHSFLETNTYQTDKLKIYIADTGSSDKEIKDIINRMKGLYEKYGVKIILIRYSAYNFSMTNNNVVKNYVDKDTDILCFCNNDIKFVEPIFDYDVMKPFYCMKLIGTVGIKLLYGNGKIQHCGIGISDTKLYHIQDSNDDKDMDYTIQSFGNTGAFLMTRYNLFNTIGGFSYYEKCFEDVQYNIECLKRCLVNYTVLSKKAIHYTSVTRNNSFSKTDLEKITQYCMNIKKLIDTYIKLSKETTEFINNHE